MHRIGSGVVIEESVEVSRPVEEVFDYCTDIAREPEWNSHTRYVEKLTGGPVREGTRYKAEWMAGDPMIVEYVEVDRPRSWMSTGRSRRLLTVGEGHVVPTPGGSRIDVRMVLQPRGLMSAITPVLARLMRGREKENLRALKSALEHRSA
jgi:uncharacterized protein YndB with AHSA1/START domain